MLYSSYSGLVGRDPRRAKKVKKKKKKKLEEKKYPGFF
jgi:hypothetical protein